MITSPCVTSSTQPPAPGGRLSAAAAGTAAAPKKTVGAGLLATRALAAPKALLIGDSISIGYTPHVVAALKGKVEVRHHRGNAQHTGTGLKMLDRWIGETEWDVIHFNWGLWDLCYRHPYSQN